jgi:predicted nuclease of predicted toxin-antitoxin system
MRLLVDEALQDAVAHRLAMAGHDTTHVRILGRAGHTDDEVMALAIADNRILVTVAMPLVSSSLARRARRTLEANGEAP